MAVMTVRVEGSRACFSMLESLEKLEKLQVKAVYPGHGRPFTDMASALGKTRRRLKGFLQNKTRIGNDLLKKIIVYTLMMKKGVEEASFFDHLMTTHWYCETVDLYFGGEYRFKYEEIMRDFLDRGIVKNQDGRLVTSVKP